MPVTAADDDGDAVDDENGDENNDRDSGYCGGTA
jgi:hypothetical protein